MRMSREEFDVLVHEVERGVGRDARRLRRHVLWLAAIGYIGLLGGLIVVVGIAAIFLVPALRMEWTDAILLYIIGIVVLLGGGFAVMKVLWVRLKPPKGLVVTRAESPQLFAALDDLQKQLRSKPFHEVLVVAECNAAVVQHARLGVFGWPRNYLLLGLPLLDGLSADEMRAVLAHEFAHLSRQHGRMGQRVYCLRRSWEKVFEQLSKPQVQGQVSLRPLYVKFIEWFWPRFNAHAFVLSRADEYEADGDAARLVGAQYVASSLFWIKLAARMFEDHFWPDVWQRANVEAEPPADALIKVREYLRKGFPANEAGMWAEQAFNQKTTNADTHPCLTERLKAVGCYPESVTQNIFPAAPSAPAVSASEAWFGDRVSKMREELGATWAKQVHDLWRDRHARANALQNRLARLDQSVPTPDTDVDALWDKARVVIELQREKEAEPLLRQILTLNPRHCAANFLLGRLLLDNSNPDGVGHLEAVMTEDDESVPAASKILHAHYWRTGQTERLSELNVRLDRYEKNLAASHKERSSVQAGDTFIPHGLSEEELQKLRATLAADPQLAFAELAQKEMKHFPKQKFFVLCVHRWPAWHRLPNTEQDRVLVNRLARVVQLPGRVLVIPPSGTYKPLARKIQAVPGAEVYRHAGIK